jgi:hypothetical protein
LDDITEEQVTEFLDTGMEILRMIKEGDPQSDDGTARELYDDFFNIAASTDQAQ